MSLVFFAIARCTEYGRGRGIAGEKFEIGEDTDHAFNENGRGEFVFYFLLVVSVIWLCTA